MTRPRAVVFQRKPFEPGARITWRHFNTDGTESTRTGVVWDRAPSVPGAAVVCWVNPDVPQDDDPYCVLAVGKSTRLQPVFGGWVAKQELFSTSLLGHGLSNLMSYARTHAERVRSTT